MKALTYIEHGKFALSEKPKPEILDPRDAVVRVTLGSICTSDLHIKHGSVPRAVPGITVGHEMVGVVESVGSAVTTVKPGDRVTVNVETFCGECFFCQRGFVNNCTDPNGGWALGCRIDGGQAEFVRVPYADQGLNKIPDSVSDEQALFVGDVLATGFWAARISEITEDDTVLIIGAGPTGLCTLMCVLLKNPRRVIVCEKDPARIAFVRKHYPEVLVCEPENCKAFTLANSDHGGADVVLEVAGAKDTFRLAWDCARPNAIVTVVALYDEAQTLPLPDMYGKNLTFKTGGVDGCDCAEILALIEAGKIDTTPLITHRYKLEDIEEAYHLFKIRGMGLLRLRSCPEIGGDTMKYNNVLATLRCWCATMTAKYADQYDEERNKTGQSLRFFRYLVTDELQYKLGTLVDRDFSDFQELQEEISRLMSVHLNTTLSKQLDREEASHVHAAEDAFLEYLATVTPDCPHPAFPYVRNIIGTEADTMITKFRAVWNYDPTQYWYPLDGKTDDSKLFILFDYVQPHLEEISQLTGIPENHIFEYGENWYPGVPACAEVDEIVGYGGCEVAYTDRDFTWIIYFSHEDTVTFAGSIVPQIKKILASEAAHWNSWE